MLQKFTQHCPHPLTPRRQGHLPGIGVFVIGNQSNIQTLIGQRIGDFVGPFDHDHAVAAEILVECQIVQARRIKQAVDIEVVQGNAPAEMLGDQREGRRVDRRFRRQAEAKRQPLRERCLARAEVADEADKVARLKQDAETGGKSASLGGAVCGIR